MTVAELGERMDAAELMAWIERDATTHTEGWLQTALICQTICQLAGNKKAKLDDFLPRKRPPGHGPTEPPPDLVPRLLAWAQGMKARPHHG